MNHLAPTVFRSIVNTWNLFYNYHCSEPNQIDETAHLLDHEDNTDHEETDSRPNDELQQSLTQRDVAQVQSDRIRSRYLSQILPNTNIPDRQ